MKGFLRRGAFIAILALATGFLAFFLGRITAGGSSSARGKAPLIGIASLTSGSYIRAVREAGGIPVVLPNTDGNADRINDYLALLDGLLMPGGADIPPSEYGEAPHETVALLDEDRFHFEKALIHAWIERTDKPLLGICLGNQWINVSSGGSLIQDIPSEFKGNHRDTTHLIAVEPDSRLGRIFCETTLTVNSLHHQAVRNVGKGLRIVARCPDGIVEAVESTDPDRFLIGVQWHPEKLMPDDAAQTKLLKAFIDASSKARIKQTPIIQRNCSAPCAVSWENCDLATRRAPF